MKLITIGNPEDICSRMMQIRAENLGVNWFHLDESELGTKWKFDRVDQTTLFWDQQSVDLSDALIFPRFDTQICEDATTNETSFIKERRASIHAFLDGAPGIVVNRPFRGLENGSKPTQMISLEHAGFDIPDWIASNDNKQLSEFTKKFEKGVIAKSISGLRSRVSMLQENAAYKQNELTTPILAQQFIEGDDVRVHTVLGKCVATQVKSTDDIDFRWSEQPVSYQHIELPSVIDDKCISYANSQGMALAGFDFKIGQDEKWWCLEMNPAPSISVYEIGSGFPISEVLINRATDQFRQHSIQSF